MICKICKFRLNSTPITVKEMMHGSRDKFNYYNCSNCNCLQIEPVPNNLVHYYKNYYTENKNYVPISIRRRRLWQVRRFLSLSFLYPFISTVSYNSILHWARISKININSNILDVGCGNGDVLYEFSKNGFLNLIGIDPLVKDQVKFNINLYKKDLLSFKPGLRFDLIMFNHSFEHISDQQNTLSRAVELLSENGVIMIRTPVVNKAFEIYKENWVQIDAPRHLIIHSIKSIGLLCNTSNTKIFHSYFDSTPFQFLGSEQFRRGISTYAANSYKTDVSKSIFTHEDILMYAKKALAFNQSRLGDQAVFFIKKR